MSIFPTNKIEKPSHGKSTLNSFGKEGSELSNSLSTMNLEVLKERFMCADIFPVVETNLVRIQDRINPRRTKLAKQIADDISVSMSEVFAGNEKDSKLVLAVQVTVVSDGSQQYTEKLAEMLGQGKANGRGLPKVTISYCLFHRKTGDVAIAKQLSRSGGEQNRPVLDMAAEIRDKINEEVQFTCCSRLDGWMDLAKTMLAVYHINPTES